MKLRRSSNQSAFTLAEMSVAMLVGIVVAMLSLTYLRTGTILFAKNVAVNMSNNDLRSAMDAIADRVETAVYVPTLVTATGAVTTTSPSAGVYYDRLLGDPYVVTQPGGAGIAPASKTVTITRSTNVYASPPIPVYGDVLLIDGADVSVRPIVQSVSVGSIVNSQQTITVTFTAAIGAEIDWIASQVKLAKLVRREAVINVITLNPTTTANGRSELRRYPSFDTSTTAYTVLSRQSIPPGQTVETTPFSISTVGLDKLLNIDFRERSIGFDNVTANQEINSFSSYMRVQCIQASRQRPRN